MFLAKPGYRDEPGGWQSRLSQAVSRTASASPPEIVVG